MKPILTAPNPVLRQVCKPVTILDKKVLDTIKDMKATLIASKNPQGVGLASPQIGVPLRIFMVRPLPDKTITTFINPEITHYSQRTTHPDRKDGIYEGCLSIPGHYAPLTRSMSVTVKYQKLSTSPLALSTVQESFSGFPAHIIQHETDHLNGILFIDRVLEQNSKLYRSEGRTWHEISI